MGTRWSEENCVALCYGCHQRWEGDKQGEYMDFMLERIGEARYKALKILAKGAVKFSVTDLLLLEQDFKKRYGNEEST